MTERGSLPYESTCDCTDTGRVSCRLRLAGRYSRNCAYYNYEELFIEPSYHGRIRTGGLVIGLSGV